MKRPTQEQSRRLLGPGEQPWKEAVTLLALGLGLSFNQSIELDKLFSHVVDVVLAHMNRRMVRQELIVISKLIAFATAAFDKKHVPCRIPLAMYRPGTYLLFGDTAAIVSKQQSLPGERDERMHDSDAFFEFIVPGGPAYQRWAARGHNWSESDE